MLNFMHFNALVLILAIEYVQSLAVPDFPADVGSSSMPLPLEFTIGSTNELKKRAVTEKFQNVNDISYNLDLYLGSNKQKSSVIIDTGSSDLWVPASTYDYTTSDSAKDTGNPFSIEYADGTAVNGEFYTDKLALGSNGSFISQFQFAAAVARSPGVLGIADRRQESTQELYDNLPWALKRAGLIPKASYSLYLSEDHGSGVIIFGGIDNEKYEGDLVKYGIVQDMDSLALNVQSVTAEGQKCDENNAYVLDSGTSLALVSEGMMEVISGALNVDMDGFVSCEQPKDQYIAFNFGKNTVKVPYSDSIYSNGDGTCSVAFSASQELFILGDVFLRHAYVYYDLTDHTISLAQVKHSMKSNVTAA